MFRNRKKCRIYNFDSHYCTFVSAHVELENQRHNILVQRTKEENGTGNLIRKHNLFPLIPFSSVCFCASSLSLGSFRFFDSLVTVKDNLPTDRRLSNDFRFFRRSILEIPLYIFLRFNFTFYLFIYLFFIDNIAYCRII